MDYAVAGAVTGAVGDIALQVTDLNDGLRDYFRSSHPIENIAYASALTAFWSGVYGKLPGTKSALEFAAFAAAIDILYRYHHKTLYPSLAGYYKHNSFVATVAYNAITALLVDAVRNTLLR